MFRPTHYVHDEKAVWAGRTIRVDGQIEGDFFTWLPLNLLSLGWYVTDFKRNVRVPDCPPPPPPRDRKTAKCLAK